MRVNFWLWSNQMMAMMIAGTWRKFLCLHWKAPLGAARGPHSNISPAHRGQRQKKIKISSFGQKWKLEKRRCHSYFSPVTLSSTQTGALMKQHIQMVALVSLKFSKCALHIKFCVTILLSLLSQLVSSFCLPVQSNFVTQFLSCPIYTRTRCQKCTGLAPTTPHICQIITSSN